MNLEILQANLKEHNVPAHWYSLDEGLKPDACIIYRNYSVWECFYLDEKGNRNMESLCRTDEEAYDWLWSKMEGLLRFRRVK